MTTNTKDITELDRLLKKLDHEDLDVLRVMLEEVYESREALADSYINGQQDEYYDKGYKDGYETALSEATEDNGYEARYADGYDSGGSYD